MSDADLTQYNRTAVAAEAANAADALTSQLLVITDNKLITGELNGANQAPVNRALKLLGDMIAGVRGSLWGNVTGINRRTVKSLHVDGTGGAVSSAPDGTGSFSAIYGGAVTPQTAVPHGTVTKDSPVFGYGSVYWSGVAYSLDGGLNVYGIVGASGSVTITLASAAPVPASCIIVVSSYRNGSSPRFFEVISTPTNVASRLTFVINIFNLLGALTDSGFSFVVHSAGA